MLLVLGAARPLSIGISKKVRSWEWRWDFGIKDGKQLAPVDGSTPGAVYDLLLPNQSGVCGVCIGLD